MSDKHNADRIGDVNSVVLTGIIDEPQEALTKNQKKVARANVSVAKPGMNGGVYSSRFPIVAYGYCADEVMKMGGGKSY